MTCNGLYPYTCYSMEQLERNLTNHCIVLISAKRMSSNHIFYPLPHPMVKYIQWYDICRLQSANKKQQNPEQDKKKIIKKQIKCFIILKPKTHVIPRLSVLEF